MDVILKFVKTSSYTLDRQRLFAIRGTVADLEIAETRINLLAKLKGRSPGVNAVTGVANALSGMYGLAASSVMLATYDGETVYSFTCLVDGKPTIGQFEQVRHLKAGDKIIAVVSEEDGLLFAHAIMDQDSGIFMMPLNVYAAEGNLFKNTMMFGLKMWIGIAVFIPFVHYFLFYDANEALGKHLSDIGVYLAIVAAFLFLFQLWEYLSFRGDGRGDYAGAIFKVFGFPKSDKIDLIKMNCVTGHDAKWPDSYSSELVMKAVGRGKIRR